MLDRRTPRRQRLRAHQPQLRSRPVLIRARRRRRPQRVLHRTGWTPIRCPWTPGLRRGRALDCVLTDGGRMEKTGADHGVNGEIRTPA